MRHPSLRRPSRRRALALTLPAGLAGLLGLAACTSDEPAPTGSTSPSGTGTAPVLPATPIDPTPTVEGVPAPTVVGTDLRLPLEMTIMIVARPGWTAPTQQLDGMFLGYATDADALRFIAVGEDGTIAWTARRPLACTRFALSRTEDDRAVAALADLAASTGDEADGDGRGNGSGSGSGSEPGAVGVATTVTGYDLATAESLWGPVDVPGPQAAPGLVFAPPGDQPMGAGGNRVALSASTGEVAVADADLGGGRIIVEHLGTILHTDGEQLVAVSATDGARQWDLDLPSGVDPSRLHVVGEVSPDTSLAVIGGAGDAGSSSPGGGSGPDGSSGPGGDAAGAGDGLLVDLRDGRVITERVSAVAHDLATEVTVVVSGAVVTGLDPDGTERWRHVDVEPLQLVSAGERLAYAVRPTEGTLVVLDTLQGLMVQPYDADVTGTLGMPETFNAAAATAVRFGDERYLVTTTLDESFGMRT